MILKVPDFLILILNLKDDDCLLINENEIPLNCTPYKLVSTNNYNFRRHIDLINYSVLLIHNTIL